MGDRRDVEMVLAQRASNRAHLEEERAEADVRGRLVHLRTAELHRRAAELHRYFARQSAAFDPVWPH
jgi:hypothetical protein